MCESCRPIITALINLVTQSFCLLNRYNTLPRKSAYVKWVFHQLNKQRGDVEHYGDIVYGPRLLSKPQCPIQRVPNAFCRLALQF